MFVENGFGMAYLEQIMYNVWCQRKQKPVMVPKVYMGSTFKGGKRWRKDYMRHAWVSLQLHILKTLTKTSYTERSNQCPFTNIWQCSISTYSLRNVILTISKLVHTICITQNMGYYSRRKLRSKISEYWCKMSLVLCYLEKPFI